jgi:hypothetical protein
VQTIIAFGLAMYGMRGDPISDSAAGRRTPDIHGPDPQQLVKIAARGERYEADGQIASFNVVFASSYRAPGNVTPEIESAFNRTFKIVRVLPCDVPLGDHPAQYNMAAKHARLSRARRTRSSMLRTAGSSPRFRRRCCARRSSCSASVRSRRTKVGTSDSPELLPERSRGPL